MNDIQKKIEEIDKKIASLKEERWDLANQNTGYFVGDIKEEDGEIITRILTPLSYGTETQAINWAKQHNANYYMIPKEDYSEFLAMCEVKVALDTLPSCNYHINTDSYDSKCEEFLADEHVLTKLGWAFRYTKEALEKKYEWLADSPGYDIVEYELWEEHLSEY